LQTVTKNDLADPFIFGLSFGAATGAVFVITVIGNTISIWALCYRQLDCLLAGNDVAQTMGVNTKKLQTVVFVVCAFATSCFVSIIGVVGFIGLMVPHIAKKIAGPLHKKLLITSALIGGLVMLLSDILARTLVAPQELPLGVVTTVFGALFIISILMDK
jgi:iron complex transport system permease protein